MQRLVNKANRYYRCRATWATAITPKNCDAPYVRAKELEAHVWKAITDILRNPSLVVDEIRRRQGNASLLDKEIARLKSQTGKLRDQERRLVRLYSFGEIDDKHVRREMELIKRQRREAETELASIEKQKAQIESLDEVNEQVKELCARTAGKLNSFGFDEKRLALGALQTKVVVGRSGVKLFGVIPESNATIGQTSA